jgi:hypothetical protein
VRSDVAVRDGKRTYTNKISDRYLRSVCQSDAIAFVRAPSDLSRDDGMSSAEDDDQGKRG